ncbi:MAG: aldehyde dehydrogenase family protein, partial [Gemmatimonadales bacterium]|nr:aldehyde dehydrogenase family protein [Gemmatimonadales bacterium]
PPHPPPPPPLPTNHFFNNTGTPTMTTVREAFDTLAWGPAPESAQQAREWLDAHGRRFGHYLGGRWTEPDENFIVSDPATGGELALATQGSSADVDAAVAAARAALPGWQALGGHGRARWLYAIARGIQRRSRLFAVVESLDNGKPIRESRDIDIPLVARHFYHHAGWAQLLDREFPDAEAVGVVGQVIPWNFPLLMFAWKVAPALAAGNTVVIKPAEYTPLTALCFADLLHDIGLPAGVVNVITGDGRTGAALVGHDDVDKVAFTGSTDVGRAIRNATAGSGKKLTLELGGKSPFIVFDDADVDSVVEGVVDAIWFNQGQVCCAGSRILVAESIADALVTKLRARMETLRVGSPLDKAVDIGAIVAPVQLERITELVAQGVAEGSTCWQPSWAVPTEGLFYPPTLFTNVSPAATIAQEEIFGPVVVLLTFRTPVEAVEIANNTRYGLAASVWSENVNLALDVAPKLKAGTVWINCTNMFDAASGFGGYRESGFGREGGREGMWEYLKLRRAEGIPERTSPPPPATGDSRSGEAGSPRVATGQPLPLPAIDRTPKLYIGGKQVRPDSGYAIPVRGQDGQLLGDVGHGNRKDIRNAVEAAHAAAGGWSRATAHLRAQVLYYLGENLSAREGEFGERLRQVTGASGTAEVEAAIRRCFSYAAWADKYDGAVHHTPWRNVTLAMPEPMGVIGIVAPDEAPLLGFLSLVLPAIAMGNTVVAVPALGGSLLATDLYQVLETSDLPGGVVNIVTGPHNGLLAPLAGHDDVDAVWVHATRAAATEAERLSTGNLKRTWTEWTERNWLDQRAGEGPEFLRQATQVKNIWVPYGA